MIFFSISSFIMLLVIHKELKDKSASKDDLEKEYQRGFADGVKSVMSKDDE